MREAGLDEIGKITKDRDKCLDENAKLRDENSELKKKKASNERRAKQVRFSLVLLDSFLISFLFFSCA